MNSSKIFLSASEYFILNKDLIKKIGLEPSITLCSLSETEIKKKQTQKCRYTHTQTHTCTHTPKSHARTHARPTRTDTRPCKQETHAHKHAYGHALDRTPVNAAAHARARAHARPFPHARATAHATPPAWAGSSSTATTDASAEPPTPESISMALSIFCFFAAAFSSRSTFSAFATMRRRLSSARLSAMLPALLLLLQPIWAAR